VSGEAIRDAAAGALRLRAWALGVLAGGDASPAPAADAAAWDVFLAVERCALPLRRALGAAGALDLVGPPGRDRLDRRGTAEAMNLLALRNEAASIARMLGRRGWSAIVPKGGAAVLAGACEVDVQDLDVLVRPEHAHELAAEMDAAGYVHDGPDFAADAPNRHQMAPRARPGSIMVEVHFALAPRLEGDPWAGALPLPIAGLLRLAPADHLWNVLAHATLHHPERRGALRDLVVAAAGVRWCGDAELREVERRCAEHPRGELPGRMLRMARALAAGRAEDLFRREAATAALMSLWLFGHRPRPAVQLALERTAFALAQGHGEYATLWHGSHVSVFHRGYPGPRGSRAPPAGWPRRTDPPTEDPRIAQVAMATSDGSPRTA
jgi:hypothetical protein